MGNEKAFISLEILFSLFTLSIISILLVFVISNNIDYLNKNKSMSTLRLNAQNMVDKINNDSSNDYLLKLREQSSILIQENRIRYYINKNIIDDKLWELEIKSYYIDKENINIEWVIVIEAP